jgi:hypothetical protein
MKEEEWERDGEVYLLSVFFIPCPSNPPFPRPVASPWHSPWHSLLMPLQCPLFYTPWPPPLLSPIPPG